MDVARERGGYGIWVDFDAYDLLSEARDVMLTSVMKNMGNSVFDVIESAVNGTFAGCTDYIGTIANGGVGLASFHDLADEVPDALKDEIEALEAKIFSGEITDTGCVSYPEWCGGLY